MSQPSPAGRPAHAGKPRLSGARAALEALGVPNAERQAGAYAERKQKRLEELIHIGSVAAFPDALRFVQAVQALGWPMAVASSSKNANSMMQAIRLDSGRTLLDLFSANVCGRDLRQGKPNPEIFLLAAAELRVAPERCFVAEDAPAGIEAARAGRMTALGVARLGDAAQLQAAGADLVVTKCLHQNSLANGTGNFFDGTGNYFLPNREFSRPNRELDLGSIFCRAGIVGEAHE